MTETLRRPTALLPLFTRARTLAFSLRAIGLAAFLTALAFTTQAATPVTLAPNAKSARPLAVGASAPDATVVASDGTTLSLAAALAEKPTVLVFYRGGWCPYCNKQLAELAAFEPQFLALGFQIIALSTDAPAGLAPTTAKNKIAYRLLSDRAMSAASAYGVAFRADPATVERYRTNKIDLAPVPGETSAHWLPVPTVFVIGRDRVIRFAASNPDIKIRLPAADLLAAARAAVSE